jgi:hypothetical protein
MCQILAQLWIQVPIRGLGIPIKLVAQALTLALTAAAPAKLKKYHFPILDKYY